MRTPYIRWIVLETSAPIDESEILLNRCAYRNEGGTFNGESLAEAINEVELGIEEEMESPNSVPRAWSDHPGGLKYSGACIVKALRRKEEKSTETT